MNGHILVIDYNPEIKEAIEAEWAEKGFALTWVMDASLAVQELKGGKKDYSLIAIKREHLGKALMPSIKSLRNATKIPIIILASNYSASASNGSLDLGADAYLCIPKTLKEGVAAGYALIRRYTQWGSDMRSSSIMSFPGGLQIDVKHTRVLYKGCEIRLPRKMFGLLLYLASRKNLTVSYAELYSSVWEDAYDPERHENALRSAMKGIRQRFRAISHEADYFITERHVGYRFTTLGAEEK